MEEEKPTVIERYERIDKQVRRFHSRRIEESFSFYDFPEKHRSKIRTTNSIERVFVAAFVNEFTHKF